MTNFVQDIVDFHKKFEIGYSGPPRDLPYNLFDFRRRFMQEELNEYERASTPESGEYSREKQLDALVDLLYVTFGTAHLHGFNIQEAWNRVHQANMQKVLGKTHRVDESGTDVAKPPGWKAPDLSDLV